MFTRLFKTIYAAKISVGSVITVLPLFVAAQNTTDHSTRARGVDNQSTYCFKNLPPDAQILFDEMKDLLAQVRSGQIPGHQAASIVKNNFAKKDWSSEQKSQVLALLAMDADQKSEGMMIKDLFQQSAEGDAKILSLLKNSSIENPEQYLAAIRESSKRHLAPMLAAGARLTDSGWDLTNLKLNSLQNNEALKNALAVFFPHVADEVDGSGRPIAKRALPLGPAHVLLPTGKVQSSAQYQKNLLSNLDGFVKDLEEYMKAGQAQSSYFSLMEGRLRGRKKNEPSSAELVAEGAHRRLLIREKYFKERLGVDPSLQAQIRQLLKEAHLKEADAIARGIKTIESAQRAAKIAVAAGIAFPVAVKALPALGYAATGAAVTKFGAVSAGGLGIGMGLTAASAGIDANRNNGSFWCSFIEKHADTADETLIYSMIFSGVALVAQPAVILQGARAVGKPISVGAAQLTTRRIFQAFGVAGLGFTGLNLAEMAGHHHNVGEAERAKKPEIADYFRGKRDQAAIDASLGLVATGAVYHRMKKYPGVPVPARVDLARKQADLAQKRLKDFKNVDELEEAFADYVKKTSKIQGGNEKLFREYWKQHKSKYMDPVKAAADPVYAERTLAQIYDDAIVDLYISRGPQATQWKDRISFMKAPTIAAMLYGGMHFAWEKGSNIAARAGTGFAKQVGNAVLISSTIQLQTAYTEPGITPLLAYLRQRGSKDLAFVYEGLQEWVISQNGAREKLSDVKLLVEEMKKTLEKKGSADEREIAWTELQTRFAIKFRLFQQALPPNLRDGRFYLFSAEFMDPVLLADLMSQRMLEHLQHKETALKYRRMMDEGKKLNREENNLMIDAEVNSEIALDHLANAVATVKIRQFLFGDDLAKPMSVEEARANEKLYALSSGIARNMHTDYYNEKVADQLKELIGLYEVAFNTMDRALAGSATPAPASADSVKDKSKK